LVNPWGIVFAPGAPVWTSNNDGPGGGSSTLYDGNGKVQGGPLIVTFGTQGGVAFNPTGIVFNGSQDFKVTGSGSGAMPAAASFIYSGEAGMIAGWSGADNSKIAVVPYQAADGAVYKGLAIANNGSGNFLYATDFHNNKIDVFDANYAKQPPSATSFSFSDPKLPAGYAPFGIQAVANGPGGAVQLYVTYAQPTPPENHDNIDGAGLGLVDIFDTNGNLVKELVPAGGALNAPWGIAVAPANFGTFSNDLLVSNFGDGKINAYDPGTGQLVGTLGDTTGASIVLDGLWGIAFGNDAVNQPSTTLFFAAGPNKEISGLYGRIDLAKAP
jgi:uncharacterized protein (TIGR03118 family)